ncbi:MAG: hypothetical protein ABS949_19855 [Solibacillus sp.]
MAAPKQSTAPLKGQVLHWYEPEVDIKYAHAQVNVNLQELYMFYNASYDYIAFTTNRSLTSLQFVDYPALTQSFGDHYQVLTVTELEEP